MWLCLHLCDKVQEGGQTSHGEAPADIGGYRSSPETDKDTPGDANWHAWCFVNFSLDANTAKSEDSA